jgi:hypothetical protein
MLYFPFFLFFVFTKRLVFLEHRNVSQKKQPKSYETVRVFCAFLCNQHSTRIIRVFIDKCHVWCNPASYLFVLNKCVQQDASSETAASPLWHSRDHVFWDCMREHVRGGKGDG